MKSLKEHLVDWEDLDTTAYKIAVVMGIVPEGDHIRNNEYVFFWSEHQIGEMIHSIIIKMIELGILETSNEDQLRWNLDYHPSMNRSIK